MMSTKLELLVPVELLPEEGVEIAPFKSRNGSTSNADLLTYYLELTEGNHLGFRVDGNGIDQVSGADGIDIVGLSLGDAFPHGVFVTHDARIARQAGRRVALRDGQIDPDASD